MAKILVVDDLAMDRRLVREFLKGQSTLEIAEADDGAAALEHLDQAPADLVVTDLLMPRMDGLELVKTIRRQYPLVPVILMTSQGSEDIAVAALNAGAASYVPKRRMAQDLLSTVLHVLAVSSRQRNRSRLFGCMTRSRSSFLLQNDAALFDPLTSLLQESAVQLGVCDEIDCTRLGVALIEALTNALYHGNLEMDSTLRTTDEARYWALVSRRRSEAPYGQRRIHVEATLSSDAAQFQIRDEGRGFDPAALPDPTDPDNLEKAFGRGILLMRTFMDCVTFNPTGNEVSLSKFRRADSATTDPQFASGASRG